MFGSKAFDPTLEASDGTSGKSDSVASGGPELHGDNAERVAAFLSLYKDNYRQMYLFAKTLLPNCDGIDDILQDVSLLLWKKFDTFRPGSNFTAWAFQMLRIESKSWLRKRHLERRHLSEEFIEMAAKKLAERGGQEIGQSYNHLIECVEILSPKSRDLVTKYYFNKLPIKEIAKQTRRTVAAVTQHLHRIRKILKDCIFEKMNREPCARCSGNQNHDI